MKRSPLKRKTSLQPGGPIKTRKPIKRTSAKRRPVRAANDERWRCEPYLAFVRSLPCCLCGGAGEDAHHVIGLHWGLSGTGLTAPDAFAMPLCRTHHQKVHASPELQRLQPDWLRWTISRGVRKFGGEIQEALKEAWAFIDAKEEAA